MNNPEERWKSEVRAGHRWGREWSEFFTRGLPREFDELEKLWQAAAPLGESDVAIMDQVIALEICHWNLNDGIVALTEAIGTHQPASAGIGHGALSSERWTEIWAYYLGLQHYLWAKPEQDSFSPVLDKIDQDGTVRNKVSVYLGERNEVKELLVQRLLYSLNWITSRFSWNSTWHKAQDAGIKVLEDRIQELGGDMEILKRLKWHEVDGRLQPCSHKLFRRLDIIISSIGAGKWRGSIPFRGTDGLELAQTLDTYLEPVSAWIQDGETVHYQKTEPGSIVLSNLGKPDPAKRFLAKLLLSLLTSQWIAAKLKGEKRSGK